MPERPKFRMVLAHTTATGLLVCFALLTPAFGQQYCVSDLSKEMTITCSDYDTNGSPSNPDWAVHAGQQHGLALKDRHDPCFKNPDSPDCTAQSATTSRDPAPRPFSLCPAGSLISGGFDGHINWTPSTFEGRMGWLNFADDSDINLQIIRDDQVGLTYKNEEVAGRSGSSGNLRIIEVEFASGETMARFSTPWWSSLHDTILDAFHDEAENSNRNAYQIVRAQLHPACADIPPQGVVYGLFGLDCVHGCRSEIHPAYVVALQVDAKRSANKWALFARNTGDEGSCSTQQHPLTGNQVQVLLPYSGPGIPELVPGESQFGTTDPEHIKLPIMRFIPGKGVLVTFTLTDAGSADLAELFLTVKWNGAQEDESDCRQLPYDVNRFSEEQLRELSDRTQESTRPAQTPTQRHAAYQESLTTMALTRGRYRHSKVVPIPPDARIEIMTASAEGRFSLQTVRSEQRQSLRKPEIDQMKIEISRRATNMFCLSLPVGELSKHQEECSQVLRGRTH